MNIPSKYNPKITEEKWYNFWQDNGFFHSEPDDRPSYTIVIPPPNVTGVLHMGHMLNNTIQDILIRKARMSGFNACWVPGTDHASIATEAKVVHRLKEKGISKADLTREEFMDYAWEWTHEHGGVILEQLKKLGASCDWDRTKFTLDEDLSASVIKVFVDLYNKGQIYRGFRMINWDPQAKTNISDEEVNHIEQAGKLYYVNYPIEGEDGEFITIATTRPETILGDTAICVNPNDERFTKYHGKNVIVPIVGRSIPIIQDDYVDMEFGTGALKITPAHDVNDYEIGKRHDLEIIDVLDDDANLNEHGLHYQGKNRFVVRKEFSKELEEKGFLAKVEDYKNKVGTSERTGEVIEPKLSVQWFLKMDEITKPALKAIADKEINLYPEKYKNTWNHWLENTFDWNISRQLYWGHRIPAYFYGEGMEDFVVATTQEEALKLAQEKSGKDLKLEDLRQEDDVLDTWFSSWLWPISVFNGVLEPDNKEINYYYPTQDLVTGPDIIFFWVARMVMAGYELRDEKPFSNVYFTGIVRDKQRRKMSKSLGNSPDPIELMNKYGADGVRVGLMLSSSAGNDLLFDEDLCLQGRNFANKIWNAFRLTQGWETADLEQEKAAATANQWFESKMNETIADMDANLEKFRISDALMSLYKLIWDDYCSTYLEAIKPAYQQPIPAATQKQATEFLENLIKLLHPYMPFITEEIWQLMEDRNVEDALIVADYPKAKEVDSAILEKFNVSTDVVSGIRNIRNEKNIPNKEILELFTDSDKTFYSEIIEKLGNVNLNISTEAPENAQSFRVGTQEFSIPLEGFIDTEAEIEKLTDEKKYLEGFLNSVRKKLGNEKFVNGAPEAVVNAERKKESDALEKIAMIEDQLSKLK